MKKVVWAVIAIVVSFASFASAQQTADKVTIQLSPSMVAITERESGQNVSAMKYRASPIQLVASVMVQDGLKVRGHVALPSGVNLPVQYVAYDNGRRFMSTDQTQIALQYRDFAVGMQWQPVMKLNWLYAIADFEATSYQGSVSLNSFVVVNGQNFTAIQSQRTGRRTLSFGAGIERNYAKFGFKAEATVAPMLSSMKFEGNVESDYYTSIYYDPTSGFGQHGEYTISGKGVGLLLAGKYFMTNHVGIEATLNQQRFSYQNSFDVDNDIHPQTRWNRYGIGVVTRF